jgi:hypothetical protein
MAKDRLCIFTKRCVCCLYVRNEISTYNTPNAKKQPLQLIVTNNERCVHYYDFGLTGLNLTVKFKR